MVNAYKKQTSKSNCNKSSDDLRAITPAKTMSNLEVDINLPAVQMIGKRGKKRQPISGKRSK